MPQRKYYRKIYQKEKNDRKIFLLLKLFILGFLLFLLGGFLLFIYYAKDLPRPEVFTERSFVLPTKIYDRSGEVLLYQIYGEEKRTVIPLEIVPEHLKQAVIVAEDANFYHHFGLDLKGILRAALANLKLWKPVQGGSTISQQLIRSSFLTIEKTMERKVKEIILTLELERRYSKDQILEFYLNQVPFGVNSYGVESASQTYFQKSSQNVSVAEAAVLAALIRAPSYLSPYGEHKNELLARKDYVLERLIQENYLTKEEGGEAKNEELKFNQILQPIKAPHFVLYVKRYLEKKYGENFLKEKGLKVFTSLNWEFQEWAEKAIKEGVRINQSYNAFNASLAAIDPKTGEILAMVGSSNWHATSSYPEGCENTEEGCLFNPKFNIATLGERQPGSAFKPFAYAVAFNKGFTPETVLWDVKTEFNPDCSQDATEEKDPYDLDCYHPKNYDEKFRGPVDLRQSLAQSINLPSVKVLYLAGVKETISLAKNLGITTLNKPLSWYGLSLVLGGGEVKLLDIVSAFGVFATDGLSIPPISILKIEDSKGNIIEENKKNPKRVLEIQTVRLINDVLSDNEARTPMFGARSLLYFEGYQVAAKTGTTQDFRDAWTIGYTPSIVVGVWAGNNNNSPMVKKPGVLLAGSIWHNFMERTLDYYPKKNFTKPESILTNKPILEGEINQSEPHSLLHYIKREDPLGDPPEDPIEDPQYFGWEESIQNWLKLPHETYNMKHETKEE